MSIIKALFGDTDWGAIGACMLLLTAACVTAIAGTLTWCACAYLLRALT